MGVTCEELLFQPYSINEIGRRGTPAAIATGVPVTLLTHGHEFFRTGWVDRNGVIEVFLGCAHFQRYREAL